jgi:hypothetical protein
VQKVRQHQCSEQWEQFGKESEVQVQGLWFWWRFCGQAQDCGPMGAVVRASQQRSSPQGLSCIFGVSHQTALNWTKKPNPWGNTSPTSGRYGRELSIGEEVNSIFDDTLLPEELLR